MRVFVLLIAIVGGVWSSDIATYTTATEDPPCACTNLGCPRNWERQLSFQQTRALLVAAHGELRTGDRRMPPNRKLESEETTPMGRLVIQQTLSVGDSSVVHVALLRHGEPADSEVPMPTNENPPEPTQVIVKYFDDCRGRTGHIDERKVAIRSMNEYVMLKVLNTTGLSPHVLYISDPLVLDIQMTGVPERMKSAFLKQFFTQCAERGTNIRFMIMERVGPSVSDYFRWIQEDHALYSSTEFTRRVLVVAQKILRLLESLHALGIVHGDIHAGNIAFRRPVSDYAHINVDTDDLVLIDFELASFYPFLLGKEVANHAFTRERNKRLRPELLSTWQNLDERPGPRDDVYRVFLIMTYWITRSRFRTGYLSLLQTNLETNGSPMKGTQEYKQLERGVVDYVRQHSPMFEYSFALGSVAIIGDDHIIPVEREIEIKHKLEQLHQFVAAYNHPDTAIDYQHIDTELALTLALFQNPSI